MKIKFFAIVGLLMVSSLSAQSQPGAFSPDRCDAILQFGIHDKENVLDFETKYNLVKTAYCKDSSFSGGFNDSTSIPGIGGDSTSARVANSNRFCRSTYNEARNDKLLILATEKASPVIASAWSQCINSRVPQTVHYFQPTSANDTFFYIIQYHTDNARPPFSARVEINLTGQTTCTPALPQGRFSVSGNVRAFTCTRKPGNLVAATAITNIGGANLKPIELPAYKETITELVAKRIYEGEAFRVVFDVKDFADPRCGVSSRKSPMGSIKNGQTYRLWYTRATNTWYAQGPNQSRSSCGLTQRGVQKSGFTPMNYRLLFWGRGYTFTEDGAVVDPDYGHVGRIVF